MVFGVVVRLAAALSYLGGIFFFGTRSSGGPPGAINDKLLHGLGFFLMVVVSYPAFALLGRKAPRWERHTALTATIYAIAAGGALELVQSRLSTRSAELMDFGADVVGAVLGYWVVVGVTRWRKLVLS